MRLTNPLLYVLDIQRNHLLSAIGRCAVYDDILQMGVILRNHAVDGSSNQRSGIVNHGNNRDERGVHALQDITAFFGQRGEYRVRRGDYCGGIA